MEYLKPTSKWFANKYLFLMGKWIFYFKMIQNWHLNYNFFLSHCVQQRIAIALTWTTIREQKRKVNQINLNVDGTWWIFYIFIFLFFCNLFLPKRSMLRLFVVIKSAIYYIRVIYYSIKYCINIYKVEIFDTLSTNK